MSKTPGPRQILGVPLLPPAGLSEPTTRLRALVGRLHRRMAPPPVQILESALSLLDHRVLMALCRAGVPDALDGPLSVEALARTVSADPERLERLVRFAAAHGWLKLDRQDRVRPNNFTRFLRTDHPGGWRAWVDFVDLEAVTAAVASLDVGPHDPFEAANGVAFFDWMEAHPDEGATFDQAMAAGGRMHALSLDHTVDWAGTSSVCDIGGGTGDLLGLLLDLHPGWRGTVLDLPEVVGRAVPHDRLTMLGGDAFTEVPGGFDTYLLVNVLHDWGDEDATRILHRTAQAMTAEARLLVVDSRARSVPIDDIALRADVLMAALTSGGKERTAEAFTRLGEAAGLRLSGTTPLVSGDLAHEFRTKHPN